MTQNYFDVTNPFLGTTKIQNKKNYTSDSQTKLPTFT